ncbi:hypothetical protein NKR23_g2132 [Pleurostoma richardsiae]|uniref:Uncharacterized protein n=1 Tax=Pleurostoma richardsiae TaxID=41990 RepID=A0AA38VYY1_9PEZI|nr:hypothetical protein NKR23_g2132 [Pleurostoma richardsiae]
MTSQMLPTAANLQTTKYLAVCPARHFVSDENTSPTTLQPQLYLSLIVPLAICQTLSKTPAEEHITGVNGVDGSGNEGQDRVLGDEVPVEPTGDLHQDTIGRGVDLGQGGNPEEVV